VTPEWVRRLLAAMRPLLPPDFCGQIEVNLFLRSIRNVNVRQVAPILGADRAGIRVARRDISALEAGEKKNPGVDVLKRLARALGVPVTELLE
jgi:transcriptional regulator with XRE-family HTH domain